MPKTNSTERRPDEVKTMFARVAGVYDIVNRAMCGGMDILWRKRLVDRLCKLCANRTAPLFVDLACGSGDVAFEILLRDPYARVVCADFCAPMLATAEKKFMNADLKNPSGKFRSRAEFKEADCANLPFPTDSFDGATVSFGFRNFNDRLSCLKEIRRVLKSGAHLHCLEVARAPKLFAPAQWLFMKWIVPMIGVAFGGKWADYRYLGETTLKYPLNSEVEKLFSDAGFSEVSIRPMMFGFVAITSAKA